MKSWIKNLLCLTATVAVLLVYFATVHSQASRRISAARLSADSWTESDVRNLDKRGYYTWVDDNGPDLSVGRYTSNLHSPVSHVDLQRDANMDSLAAIALFPSLASVQLCGTELSYAALEKFATDHPACYIWGFNNGYIVELNETRKRRLPWYEVPRDDMLLPAF